MVLTHFVVPMCVAVVPPAAVRLPPAVHLHAPHLPVGPMGPMGTPGTIIYVSGLRNNYMGPLGPSGQLEQY